MMCGRTELIKSVSVAKFDAESDFEVRLAIVPQKPSQSFENLIFDPKSWPENERSGIARNVFWQSLRPFGTNFEG